MQYNNLTDISDELGKRLVKHVLWGIGLIGCAAFLCAITAITNVVLIIEIATTSSAIMVSTVCLIHLYQEHRIWQHHERLLIEKILKRIQQNYPSLPPLALVKNCLLQVLKTTGSKELRLQTLQQYEAHHPSLDAFMHFCRQQQADIAALADLGLCWD